MITVREVTTSCDFDALVEASVAEGIAFVARLRDEWASGGGSMR